MNKLTAFVSSINRSTVSLEQARVVLREGWRAETYGALAHLLQVRRRHPAFAPSAKQVVHVVHPHVVALERGTGADRILAVHNMSAESVEFVVPETFGTTDLISGEVLPPQVTLKPWQAVWLVG